MDILVNSASIQGQESALVETSLADWQQVSSVNTDGTFLLCRAFAPRLVAKRWGRIVTLASHAGKEGNALQSAYSSSKAAVIALTQSLGKDLALDGVLVNSIAPAIISTALNSQMEPATMHRLMAKIPMSRPGQPREVAALVAWLSSNECSFCTGAVNGLSGGRATY